MRAEHREIVSGQSDAVNADQILGDGPTIRFHLQGQEMLPRRLLRTFGQMQDQLLLARYSGQEMLGVGGVDIGNVRRGRRERGVAGRLDVAH